MEIHKIDKNKEIKKQVNGKRQLKMKLGAING